MRRSCAVNLTMCAPVLALLLGACAWWRTPDPPPRPKNIKAAVETVTVRDPELEQRVARLQLRLFEDDAQLEDLQMRLDDARQEVVRAMAKLQSLASRAEAASGMAEAEIAVDSLRAAAAQLSIPEVTQATTLMQMSSAEFEKENYGGALYLANQSKAVAAAAHGHLAGRARLTARQGEVQFALPLRLRTIGNGNVREGPGSTFRILVKLEPGTQLVGYSYLDQWVRIADGNGRRGWIFYGLVKRATVESDSAVSSGPATAEE